jgi:type IV pilus assembly protein PilN
LAKETGLGVSFLSSSDSSVFDIAIAAGREEAKHINIIPLEIKEQRIRKIQHASLRLVTFISLAVLVISYLSMTVEIKSLQGQIKVASANFNSMQEVVVLKEKIDKYKSMLAQLSQNQYESYILLKVLSRSIPPLVELDSFSRRDNSEIDIKGTVSSNRPEVVLAEFTKTMEKTGVFKNIKIISMQKGSQPGALWKFSMYCMVSLKQK